MLWVVVIVVAAGRSWCTSMYLLVLERSCVFVRCGGAPPNPSEQRVRSERSLWHWLCLGVDPSEERRWYKRALRRVCACFLSLQAGLSECVKYGIRLVQ